MKAAKYNINELIENASFRRWVEGSALHQEKSYWDQWVMSDPENRALALRAQQKIVGLTIQPSSQPDQNEAWDRLEYMMKAKGDRASDITISGRSTGMGLRWMYRI
ncbi:MAG TPA: hypothetical protein VK074_09705, partial [Fodinibius sp.]|nr:hypothetical protein [Fodinibius sp.]